MQRVLLEQRSLDTTPLTIFAMSARDDGWDDAT
jgi:hypothetical protein